MDAEEFRKYGKEMVDFIADYWETMPQRKPMPDVRPGFMNSMIPVCAPDNPENWSEIFRDLDPIVLDTNTNWHHPCFFAYFPAACSYPAIMGDMLSTAIASIGFTWKSSPSMTELEMKMTDWLATAICLPDCFKNADPGPGAGMIQSTASDAMFIAVLAARSRAVKKLKAAQMETISEAVSNLHVKLAGVFENKSDNLITFPNHDANYFDRLVAYCSDQSHCAADKAIMLAGTKMRKIPTSTANASQNYCIDVEALKKAIKEDRSNGLVPFILIATAGTTSTCAVDDIKEIGLVCQGEGIWLHVDAAYLGSYMLCPEFRSMIDGVEYADSFNFNPTKGMMITFDCAPMWFKDAIESISYFNVDAEYLKHEHQSSAMDYRHLQIALGRRFRSLKVWFVLRALGLDWIRAYQRKQVRQANLFAEMIRKNARFELFVPPKLGLVCFRLKGDNKLTIELLDRLNADGRIHLVASKVNDIFFLRLAICSQKTEDHHVKFAYDVICELAAT